MVPCFNAGATLRLALASLAAQTLDDWECVAVDDGSRDETFAILEDAQRRFGAKMVVERFAQNRGRGAARQRALELSRGKFVAMIDADDFAYPERLAKQVVEAEREAGVVAVSGGMAVFGHGYALLGVHKMGEGQRAGVTGPWRSLSQPPLPFPSAMLLGEAARKAGFDTSLRFSEDADLMLRLLLERRFVLMPDVVYGYGEPGSMSLEKSLQSYRAMRKIVGRHVRRFPAESVRAQVRYVAKGVAQRVIYKVGLEGRVASSHWRAATEGERVAYEAAFAAVTRAHEELFDAPVTAAA